MRETRIAQYPSGAYFLEVGDRRKRLRIRFAPRSDGSPYVVLDSDSGWMSPTRVVRGGMALELWYLLSRALQEYPEFVRLCAQSEEGPAVGAEEGPPHIHLTSNYLRWRSQVSLGDMRVYTPPSYFWDRVRGRTRGTNDRED